MFELFSGSHVDAVTSRRTAFEDSLAWDCARTIHGTPAHDVKPQGGNACFDDHMDVSSHFNLKRQPWKFVENMKVS